MTMPLPPANYEFRQLVMNTLTGAWGPMSDWGSTQIQALAVLDGKTYALANEVLVEDSTTTTYHPVILELDVGYTDDFSWKTSSFVGSSVAAINFEIEQSYDYLSSAEINKQVRWVKPIMNSGKSETLNLGVDVDYEDSPDKGAITIPAGVNTQKYSVVNDVGGAFSLCIDGATTSNLSYIASTLEFNNGGTF